MKLLLTAINAKYIHSSLSIRYLQKYCQDLPYDIELDEYTINNHLLDIADQIFDKKPDIIGFDCYIWNIELTKQLIPLLHKMLPNAQIICGGPEISYSTAEFMQDYPMVDYVIRGEGEQVLYDLLRALSRNESTADIAGLAQYDAKRQLQENQTVVLENMDDIPFPYTDEDIKNLDNHIIYYESSRGCPFSCKYCLSCATKGVRYRSLDKVLAELTFFVGHNVKQVKFVDRTFNANKKHFIPILKFLAEQKCRTNFHFEASVDLLDDEALAILRTMPVGRVQLEIGIQSTNTKTLEQISRHNNWAKIVSNINTICSFNNIHVHTDLIIGLPNEDMKSLEKSFNEVYALYPDMLQVGFLKLLKGAAMENLVEPHKYQFMDTAPYEVLSNAYMTIDEIRKLRIFVDVFELYYNSGRFVNSLKYIIKNYENNAFAFFRSFADYWHKNELHILSHSPKALYKYLADFIVENKIAIKDVLEDLLRYDALSVEHGRFKAEFLDWSEKKYHKNIETFLKNTELVRKYIPDYEFINWRTVKNNYHIEYFANDVLHFSPTTAIISKPVIILFIYTDDIVAKILMDPGDLTL